MDAVYGPQTERALLDSPAEGFAVDDEPVGPGGLRMLRLKVPPMRGEDVTVVQRALNVRRAQLGLAPLEEDAVFGRVTERAVKEFQDASGLKPDGVVGPMTRIALGL